MWESAVPERYLELVHQSRQTSFKGFVCGSSESCDCEYGTTATDMHIFRSLTPQEQQLAPMMGEVRTVWMGSMTLILGVRGAN